MYSDSSSEHDIVFRRNSKNVKRRRVLTSLPESETEVIKEKNSNIMWSYEFRTLYMYTFDNRDSEIKTKNSTYSSRIIDYFRLFFYEDLIT